MGASQHRDRSSALAPSATGAVTFAIALLVATHCASLPVATTVRTLILATQRTTEGPTHTSAGSRDLTHTMSPANSDRCPGCASEKLKHEGNDKNEEPWPLHWNLPCKRPAKPALVLSAASSDHSRRQLLANAAIAASRLKLGAAASERQYLSFTSEPFGKRLRRHLPWRIVRRRHLCASVECRMDARH